MLKRDATADVQDPVVGVNGRSKWQHRLGTALVAVVYLAAAGWLSLRLPLWIDEVYTLHTTSAGPVEACRRALQFELQPPGYFALLALWRQLVPEPLAARLPSAIFGAGTVLVAASLSRRLMPKLGGTWAATVIASSPFLLWAGSEARVYSMAILVGAGLTLAIARVHLEGWQRGRVLVVILGTVALYTQYYLGFLLVAAGAALLLLKGRREARRYGGEMLVVALLVLPMVPSILTHLRTHPGPGEPMSMTALHLLRTVGGAFEEMATSAIVLTAKAWPSSTGALVVRWVLRLLLLAAIMWAFVARPVSRERRFPMAFLGCVTAVNLVLGWLVAVLASSLWTSRHRLGALVPVALFPLASGYAVGRSAVAAVVAVTLAGNVWGAAREFRDLAKTGDAARVAHALEAVDDDAPVLVVPAEQALVLRHYQRSRNPVVPVPKEPRLDLYEDPDQQMPRRAEDVEAVISSHGVSHTFWLYATGRERTRLMLEMLEPGWRSDGRIEFAGEALLVRMSRRGGRP